MADIAFEDDLGEAQRDWLRTRITTKRGDVVDFTAQYETLDRGRRVAVIRYDCAHGFPHVDVLNLHGDVVVKESLPSYLSMKEALNFGIDDIEDRWRAYKQRFFGESS